MKKNELTDLKTKTIDELKRSLSDLSEDLDKLKVEKIAGKLANPNAIRTKRHDIARVLTFLTMKSFMVNTEKEVPAK